MKSRLAQDATKASPRLIHHCPEVGNMITIVQFDDYDKDTTVVILEESGTKFVLNYPWPDLVRYHGLDNVKGTVTSPQFPNRVWVVNTKLETPTDVSETFQKLLSLAQKENPNASSII
jgi:hypothetical protein